jgi:hypothetical protein
MFNNFVDSIAWNECALEFVSCSFLYCCCKFRRKNYGLIKNFLGGWKWKCCPVRAYVYVVTIYVFGAKATKSLQSSGFEVNQAKLYSIWFELVVVVEKEVRTLSFKTKKFIKKLDFHFRKISLISWQLSFNNSYLPYFSRWMSAPFVERKNAYI